MRGTQLEEMLTWPSLQTHLPAMGMLLAGQGRDGGGVGWGDVTVVTGGGTVGFGVGTGTGGGLAVAFVEFD